jgi:hypothetical protein
VTSASSFQGAIELEKVRATKFNDFVALSS